MEREREILERLADVLKDDIRFAGFDMFEVLRKWSLIWSVLYLTLERDGQAVSDELPF